MFDFHCHIVYGVDDGAKTIEDSLTMIQEAKQVGFTDIILTPHYIPEYYETNVEGIKNKITEIEKSYNTSEVHLYQANELYAYEDLSMLIEQNQASSIAGTRYVLFELPMHNEILDISSMIYNLLESRYIPVIAHPERYSYVQKNPNKVLSWIEEGALLQANYGSILGIYGKEAKNTVIKMLKHQMIHFLGSDCHRPNSIYPKIPKILEELKKIITEEELYILTTQNAEDILNGNIIEIPEPKKIEESFFKKFLK